MNDWVAPAVGLAGVVIGIVLKYGIDWSMEARRLRRENELRFIDERRKLYMDYYSACRRFRQLREEGTAMRDSRQAATELTELQLRTRVERLDALLAETESQGAEVERLMAGLMLLAPARVSMLGAVALQATNPSRPRQEASAALGAFMDACATDLGVNRGGVPQEVLALLTDPPVVAEPRAQAV